MLVISDDFKNSVSATEREMKGYVEVSYTNTGAKDSASVNSYPDILEIDGTAISANYIVDDDRKGKNYASLEENYFKLDGTFVLPNNVANKNDGIGYTSNEIFEDDNTIPTTPFDIVVNPAQKAKALTMYFQNNKPLDLEVTIYSGSDIYYYSTENGIKINDNGTATVTFDEMDIDEIEIYVKDVLYTNRRVRLQEIDFGLSTIYEDEELISFKTIEQVDIFNERIPQNELEVTLGDMEGKFDFRNEDSLTKYLNEDVLLKPYVGVVTEDNGIEYCLKGTYWLQDYGSNGKEATLKGADIYSKLQTKDFDKNYVIIDDRAYHKEMSISDHIAFKAEKWGVTINDLHLPAYEINANIDDTFSKIDAKVNNLLKMAIVGGGTFNANRYGEIDYKSLYNENTTNTTNKYIDFDNMKNYPQILIKEPIKTIGVEETVVNLSSTGTLQQFYSNKFNYTGDIMLYIDLEDWKTVENPTLTNASLLTSSWSVDPTAPEGEQGYYGTIDDTYVFMKLRCNGNVTVSIRGCSNSTTTNTNLQQLEENGKDISINDDYLATSGIKNVRSQTDNIINFNKDHRNKYSASFEYNGDPTLECGDVIYIQNKYSEDYDKIIITKIESEFKGSYNEKIEGDVLE